ncbi:DUF3304 domain-containing protein [Pseudomonas saxonica]|uniref:DUF3304 domain-containing protein n=1 Tax=Pseudomonas saxonica TaxID=2600598 RepID=UPI002D7940A1|nr:DUF3304 domain-containing protein [Pseudomonas saxonica]
MLDTMICRVFLLLAASLLLQGCVESQPTMLGASISGVNHTSAAINHFSVNGGGGPNIGPYGGGPGSQMCCAMLPVQWREGLTVVVEWEKDPNVRFGELAKTSIFRGLVRWCKKASKQIHPSPRSC